MARDVELLASLLHLAWAAGRRQRPLVRCRLLILAADQALQLGLVLVAEYCRLEVLKLNPAHLIGKFGSYVDAATSNDLGALLHQLKRRYPRERVEQLLQELGLSVAAERDTYASDEEYAAALLGTDLNSLHVAVRDAQAWREPESPESDD